MRSSLRDKRAVATLMAMTILFLTCVGELLHYRNHAHALAHDAQCQAWFDNNHHQPMPAGIWAIDNHCPQCDWDAIMADAPTTPWTQAQVFMMPAPRSVTLPFLPYVRLTLALRESRGPPSLA